MSDTEKISSELQEKLDELEVLKNTIEENKKKAAEYFDQLLRLRADFDNFRKRADKEKSDARAWGKQEVLLQLISLVDVFEQALAQAHKANDAKTVVEGVDMLHKAFVQFLKTEGLEPIQMDGKPFDPEWAEAIEQQEVDNPKDAGKVLAEIQKGYRFQGRVLRHSRVRVGVAKKAESEPDDGNE
jgi:molecular chaperone GrpE